MPEKMFCKTVSCEADWTRLTTCRRNGFASLAAALGMVGLATVLRLPIRSLLGEASPFLFYLPAVLVVAIFWGRWAGILATAASVALADYFWMAPQGAFGINFVEVLELLTFSVAGVSLSLLSEKWHRERLAREHLRATLANAGGAIITTDETGRVVFLNAVAQVLTGLVGDKVAGQPIGGVLFLRSEDGQQLLNHALQQALVNDRLDDLPKKLLLLSQNGKRHRVEQRICRILDGKGKRRGAVILFQEQVCQS